MLTSLPYKILIDRSVDEKIVGLLKEMGLGKKCLIICDENILDIIGNRIKDILSSSFSVEILQESSIDKKVLEEFSKKVGNYDFVIGIGGGRNIDIAKYSSFLAKKPWIAFPTILSHDGVVSSRASLNNDGKRVSVDASEPIAIIADMDTIKKAPYDRIAAGAGDLISNLSAVEDWKIAAKAGKEDYHTLMAELSLLSAKGVIEHSKEIKAMDYHGLEILLWSLICSGFAMNIYGSSRPCSGSEHNFSHALDVLNAGALHGQQVALGCIAMTYLQGGDWKNIKEKMKELGLPTTAKEIGISKELLIEALVNSKGVRERYTILDEKDITKERAEEILKTVGII